LAVRSHPLRSIEAPALLAPLAAAAAVPMDANDALSCRLAPFALPHAVIGRSMSNAGVHARMPASDPPGFEIYGAADVVFAAIEASGVSNLDQRGQRPQPANLLLGHKTNVKKKLAPRTDARSLLIIIP
jgi:hypothetical protein